MNQARFHVAGVAEVDGGQLFAPLIERVKLKRGGGVIQPGHALGGRTPRPNRHHHLEPPEVAANIAVLAAVVQPEHAEGEDAVDNGAGFSLADADDGLSGSAAQQMAADIGGTEAVFKVHGRAHAVHLETNEVAGQDALEEAQVGAAGIVAGGRGAVVAGSTNSSAWGLVAPIRRVIRRSERARGSTPTTVRDRLRSSLQSWSRQRPCDSVTEQRAVRRSKRMRPSSRTWGAGLAAR